jgi:prevent-host-death family protein
MGAVSVTELNQQTAKVLDRVKGGESLEVKEHGRPIARIVPILAAASIIERLLSEGRLITPTDTAALLTPVPAASSVRVGILTDALQEARGAERF